MTGLVFNIQKFSIHDGPGVRTTVFLKGCPLRCKWCANPESQSGRVQMMHDREKCLSCQSCVKACHENAVSMVDGHVKIEHDKCTGCLECEKVCPGRALSHEGDLKTVKEVYDICMQDEIFYEDSGGGVTISGGEGMMQPDFVLELVKMLKESGVHTAIETTGCVGEDVFRKLAKEFDLLLFDVKHHDSEKHRQGTGLGNEQIIKNLRWAHSEGIEILPRLPVIPGFNDSIEATRGIALLLKDIGLKKLQLLPFHQMGEKKYEFLGREYELKETAMLHREELTEYREGFLKKGIDCFF